MAQLRIMQLKPWLVAGLGALSMSAMLMLAFASTASAAYVPFCSNVSVTGQDKWGGNPPGSFCDSYAHDGVLGYIDEVGGSGTKHSVCVKAWWEGTKQCSAGPNQGVYNTSPAGITLQGAMVLNNASGSNVVSAYIVTCSGPCNGGEGPPPPPPPPPPAPPAETTWALRNSHTGGNPDISYIFQLSSGEIAVAGDWNGDGKVTGGSFNPSTGVWRLRNSNSSGGADLTFQYGGGPWSKPVAGDWNGDGTTTIGVYDPSTGNWSLRNTNGPGNADYSFQYGGSQFKPVVGDWNGNGTATAGLYEASTGNWALRNTNGPGNPDYSFQYGGGPWSGPVAGDWDGNGTTTIGVYDPSAGNWSMRNTNNGGNADYSFQYGGGQFMPIAGDWDGNGSDSAGLVLIP